MGNPRKIGYELFKDVSDHSKGTETHYFEKISEGIKYDPDTKKICGRVFLKLMVESLEL